MKTVKNVSEISQELYDHLIKDKNYDELKFKTNNRVFLDEKNSKIQHIGTPYLYSDACLWAGGWICLDIDFDFDKNNGNLKNDELKIVNSSFSLPVLAGKRHSKDIKVSNPNNKFAKYINGHKVQIIDGSQESLQPIPEIDANWGDTIVVADKIQKGSISAAVATPDNIIELLRHVLDFPNDYTVSVWK